MSNHEQPYSLHYNPNAWFFQVIFYLFDQQVGQCMEHEIDLYKAGLSGIDEEIKHHFPDNQRYVQEWLEDYVTNHIKHPNTATLIKQAEQEDRLVTLEEFKNFKSLEALQK